MANSHSIGSQCSAEDDSRGVLGVRAGACAAGKTRGSTLSNDGDCVHALEEIRAQSIVVSALWERATTGIR